MNCKAHNKPPVTAEANEYNTSTQYTCGCIQVHKTRKPKTCHQSIQDLLSSLSTLNEGRAAITEWVANDTETLDLLREYGVNPQ